MTTTDAILKSEKSTSITLPEPIVNNLMEKVQDEILEIMMKEDALMPIKAERVAAVDEVDKQIEELKAKKTINETTLESLLRLKSPGKHIKMYQSLNNVTVKRHRSRDGNIPWTRTINDLLTKHGEFMTEDQIYAAILEKHPDWAFKNDLLKKKYFRYYFRDNIIKGKLKQFAFFNDKFGLSHWMENGQPKAKYLKQFMFN